MKKGGNRQQNKPATADLLDTLPKGYPEYTLGWEAAAWAEKYLIHPDGPRQYKPWRFTKRQLRFLLWFYAINPDTGEFVFNGAMRRLAKGSGKTPLAAVIAILELLAPVRLKELSEAAPGRCIGRCVPTPWICVAGTSLDHAETTMRLIRAMLSPAINKKIHKSYPLEVNRTKIRSLHNSGTIDAISVNPEAQEGKPYTLAILDELEHWDEGNQCLKLFNILSDNAYKLGNRIFGTMNSWTPGSDCVAEQVFSHFCAYEDGLLKKEAIRWLYDCRQAPFNTDLSDAESVKKALTFVYEDCPWFKIEATLARAFDLSMKPDDFKRKYFNWNTAEQDSFVDAQLWQKMAAPEMKPEPGDRIVMFFDGSLTMDTTALVGCRIEDGFVFLIGFWDPGNHGKKKNKKTVNVEEVDNTVSWAFETYNVVAFYADVKEWEHYTRVEWANRYGKKLKVWAVPKKEPIAFDMRGSGARGFKDAVALVEDEIKKGAFKWDGSPILSRHMKNAKRRVDRYGGVTIMKESKDSRNKIDAAICVIGARMARKDVLDNGPVRVRTRKTWGV